MTEYEVQVTVPPGFAFYGAVPYDMEILGNQAFVTIWADSIDEAVEKANEFFQNTA